MLSVGISSYDELSADQRAQMRRLLMCIADDTATKLLNYQKLAPKMHRFLKH